MKRTIKKAQEGSIVPPAKKKTTAKKGRPKKKD